MNIPEKALEVLARNAHDSYRNEVGLLHYTTTGGTIPEWDDLPDQEREDELDRWRDILAPAAGAMYAQALRDAAAKIDADGQDINWEEDNYGAGRRHAADELEALADELDPS